MTASAARSPPSERRGALAPAPVELLRSQAGARQLSGRGLLATCRGPGAVVTVGAEAGERLAEDRQISDPAADDKGGRCKHDGERRSAAAPPSRKPHPASARESRSGSEPAASSARLMRRREIMSGAAPMLSQRPANSGPRGQRIASWAESAARLTRSETVAPRLTIWTGCDRPRRSGPTTVPPPSSRQQLGCNVGAVQFRHDQDIGRPAQPAERVKLVHQPLNQRDIGAHLAVIVEAGIAPVEHGNGVAHAMAVSAHRVTEIRVGQQGDPRHEGEFVRLGRRLDGDVGELLRRSASHQPRCRRSAPCVRGRAGLSGRKACEPGFAAITREISSSASKELRVTPVTRASASLQATIQAANTLRSWFTIRWQSR